jgi:hypothetical protein
VNRRSFLQALGVGAAGAALAMVHDPEKALWVPGQRTYFDVRPGLHLRAGDWVYLCDGALYRLDIDRLPVDARVGVALIEFARVTRDVIWYGPATAGLFPPL